MINGFTELCITKLDVLSGLDEIRVCVAYRYNGKVSTRFPSEVQTLTNVEPVYESFPGWAEDISSASNLNDLPANAISYLRFVSEYLQVPIETVSTGPKRAQTVTGAARELKADLSRRPAVAP